jgi:hypothetical protein
MTRFDNAVRKEYYYAVHHAALVALVYHLFPSPYLRRNVMRKVGAVLYLAFFLLSAGGEASGTAGRSSFHFPGFSPEWGNDVTVSNSEPTGRHSAVARPTGEVYAAVPDTGGSSGYTVKIYHSTNFGDSWSQIGLGPSSATPFTKVKVVRTGVDSIYCAALTGTSIYCWNLEAPSPTLFSGEAARDFDIATTSSENELHIFIDVLANNQIRRYASIDGGRTWINAATVTSNGAHPRVYMSTGDTLVLNYYGPVSADTATSVIRLARYRKTGFGTMASINFIDIVTETVRKDQYAPVIHAGHIWFFYTSGDAGGRDIRARVSTNNGASYGAAFTVAGSPSVDEFWFDAKHWSEGCDLAYVADSTGGVPQMHFRSATTGEPSTFSPPTAFNELPPLYSEKGYIPTLVEFHDSNDDVGVLWVGSNGSPQLYWDRLNAVPVSVGDTPTGIPEAYALNQNYPNPFNPSTTVSFNVPYPSFVVIKVHDLLGREVATLTGGERTAGYHAIEWNGRNLWGTPVASGVYIYSIEATAVDGRASFRDARRMQLLR